MIDVESLARARASTLAQLEEDWLKATAEASFHHACTQLSDGEIQQIFGLSSSSQHMQILFEAFARASELGVENPFGQFKQAAKLNGLSLERAAEIWAHEWTPQNDFLKCLNGLGTVSKGKHF
jgi:hypothetical protein